MDSDTILPNGWAVKVDDRNRVYYIDHYGRTTTRNDPRLPAGWDMGITPAGDAYFHHYTTGTTTSIDPRAAKISDSDTPTYDGQTPNVT
jgi:hypothetical protein